MQRRAEAYGWCGSLGIVAYMAFLSVILTGIASVARATLQPLVLENPGLAAYKPPPAVALYPLPRKYLSPAEPTDLAVAQDAHPEPGAGLRTALSQTAQPKRPDKPDNGTNRRRKALTASRQANESARAAMALVPFPSGDRPIGRGHALTDRDSGSIALGYAPTNRRDAFRNW
jgi:hypothetical protein